MKKVHKILFLAAILVVIGATCFTISMAAGDSGDPGTDQDPLVTKGYVDSLIATQSKALQDLQAKFDALTVEKNQMQDKLNSQDQLIKALQDQVKALGAKPITPSNSGSGNTGTPATTSQGSGTINASSLNMRASASTTAAIVGSVTKGAAVTILQKSGDWYKIKNAAGVTGWVLGKYVTIKK